jgi:hypothetical protein
MAIVSVNWSESAAEREIVSLLLAERSGFIFGSGAPATVLLTGDRSGFVASETYENMKSRIDEVIYMGATLPARKLVQVIAVLHAVSQEKTRFTFVDIESDAVMEVHADSVESPAAHAVWTALMYVDAAASSADKGRFSKVLGVLPRALVSSNSGWVASAIERAAVQMRCIVDLEDQMWLGEEPLSSGGVRTRSTLAAMKGSEIYSLQRQFAKASAEVSTELKLAAAARADYLGIGAQAALRATPGDVDSPLSTLFAWWAAFFRARSLLLASQGDVGGAVGAVVREMEMTMQGRLLETGVAEMTRAGDITIGHRQVRGVSELLGPLEHEITAYAGEDVYRALGETVGCRNRSRVGHGVSALNREIYDKSVTSATGAWQGMTLAGGECPKALLQILSRLRARAIPKPSATLARQALSWVQEASA